MSETDFEDRLEVIIGDPEKPKLRLVMKPKELEPMLHIINNSLFPKTTAMAYAYPVKLEKEPVDIRKIRSEYECYRDELRIAYEQEIRELRIEEEAEIEKLSAKKE